MSPETLTILTYTGYGLGVGCGAAIIVGIVGFMIRKLQIRYELKRQRADTEELPMTVQPIHCTRFQNNMFLVKEEDPKNLGV